MEKRGYLFHVFLCFIDQAKMDGQADQLVELYSYSIFYLLSIITSRDPLHWFCEEPFWDKERWNKDFLLCFCTVVFIHRHTQTQSSTELPSKRALDKSSTQEFH